MKRSFLVALLLVISLAAGLIAGSRSQDRQAVSQNQPSFRSGVELVRLDIRVLDSEGRPVPDVQAEDLEIVDHGQVRPVVLFQRVAEPTGTYLEVARRTIGSEVSTNRGAPRGHLYVIVFDQSHITPGNEQRARMAADRFVRTRVRPGDRVALYAMPGPGPHVPLTGNTHAVLSQLIAVGGSLDKETFGTLGGMSLFEAYEITRGNDIIVQRVASRVDASSAASDLVAVRQTAASAAGGDTTPIGILTKIVKDNARTVVDRADAETRVFLSLLADIIRNLAGIEGRKAVILISEGFYGDFVHGEVERVAAAAAQAYAVVYTLDINRRGVDVNQAAPSGNESHMEILDRIEPLGSLAAETSGEMVTDAGSRLDAALNRIAEQSLDYYIVGFEPATDIPRDERDRYHRVTVRAKRPGLTVRARTGYSIKDPVFATDRRRAIDTALAAPFPQQGLPVEVTTYVSRGNSPGAHRVVMSVQAELPVATGTTPRSADVVFVAKRASDGRVVASGTDVMPLPSVPTRGSTGLGGFQVQFEALPGQYLIRVVVREPSSGVTGSVDRRFDVRSFDGTDITASDLVIGRTSGALPVRAQAYVGDVLSGMLEIYARNPRDIEDLDVTASLAPVSGEPIVGVKATLRDMSRATGAVATRTAIIELPLGGIAPGDFVVRASVRSKGETVIEVLREVQVLPGPPPAPQAPDSPRPMEPADVLNGEVAARLLASLRDRDADPAVRRAAGLALSKSWEGVMGAAPSATAVSVGGYAVRGAAWLAQGRYQQAAADLQAAWDLDPTSAATAFLLGWAHALAGNDARAITAWRGAMATDPALIPAYLAAADAYLRLAQPALAIQVLRAGLGVLPRSLELQIRLEEIQRR